MKEPYDLMMSKDGRTQRQLLRCHLQPESETGVSELSRTDIYTLKGVQGVLDILDKEARMAHCVPATAPAFLRLLQRHILACDLTEPLTDAYPSIGLRWLEQPANRRILWRHCGSTARFFGELHKEMLLLDAHPLSARLLQLIRPEERDEYAREVAVTSCNAYHDPNWVANLVEVGVSQATIATAILERLARVDMPQNRDNLFLTGFVDPEGNGWQYVPCVDDKTCPGPYTPGHICLPTLVKVGSRTTQWSVLDADQMLQAARICLEKRPEYMYDKICPGGTFYEVAIEQRFEKTREGRIALGTFVRDMMLALPDISKVSWRTARFMSPAQELEVYKQRTDMLGAAVRHAIVLGSPILLDDMLARHKPPRQKHQLLTLYSQKSNRPDYAAKKLLAYGLQHGCVEAIAQTQDDILVATVGDKVYKLVVACGSVSDGMAVLLHPEATVPRVVDELYCVPINNA